MNMPVESIDGLFKALLAVYGEEFMRKWGPVPMKDVKTAWAYQLEGFDNDAGALAVAWALDNLPERPPNAVEFRRLCRQAPVAQPAALPPPAVDPVVAAAAAAAIRRPAGFGSKDWAWKMRDRERRGGRLSVSQKVMWRTALAIELARMGSEEAADGPRR